MKSKLLFEEYGEEQQDLHYVGVYELVGFGHTYRVRVTIRRNSYDFQSYAKADLFSFKENKFTPLADVHFSKMTASSVYAVNHREKFKGAVARDSEILLERARLILGLDEEAPQEPSGDYHDQ